jgi:gliding motility-associated-like protein
MRRFYLLAGFLIINLLVLSQVANFTIPDTVCVNQSIFAQNMSTGGTSYYWNFCSGNLSSTPVGLNMGNLGPFDRPVYSSIAKDEDNYFVFISNNIDGRIIRLAFGNNLTNTPIATNLGNMGVLQTGAEGIQIKKDVLTGNWFGLIVIGGTVNNLVRLSFGSSLNNIPVASNLFNIDNLMDYPHTIYTFYENGNWYSLIGNYYNNTLIRMNFGNSLANLPHATSLGNVGNLNGPVGFYPVEESGIWYLFVVNRNSNSLSRLNFGSSLINAPTGINLGNVHGTIDLPRSITVIRDCGKVYGFVVNESTNDIVRLTFPNGLLSTPEGTSLGNIANFSFPHHISELFRVGDSLYTFIMNVNNNTISRLCFASCNNSSIPSSNLQNPPSFSYNTPGIYNISLVVNEGSPSQSNICKDIYVKGSTLPTVTGDTSLCVGDPLNLISTESIGDSFLWTGPNGFFSTSRNLIIPSVNLNNAGKYTLTVSGCANAVVDKLVSVAVNPTVTGDAFICFGDTLHLSASSSPANAYLWTGPDGFTSTSQNISIPNAGQNNSGNYTLTVSGCLNPAFSSLVIVATNPTIIGDTTICDGGTLNLSSNAAPGNTYLWTGPNGYTSTSQNLTITGITINDAGVYTLHLGGCANVASTRIVNVISRPTVLGDTSVCEGDTLRLISSATTGNSYLWTGPNGFSSTSQNLSIPNVSVSNSGAYALMINGCISASFYSTVKISTNPAITGDTNVCVGEVLSLSSNSTSGDTFLWSGPNGFTSTSQILTIPVISAINEGEYTLTLSGCPNVEAKKIVNVLTSPTVSGDTSICVGDTLHLISSAAHVDSFLWTGPNGYSSVNPDLVILNFSENQVGRYTFTFGGCTNASVNKIISIAPNPLVNLGNDTIICQGSILILNAGNSGSKYEWNTGESSQTITIEKPGTFSVNVSKGLCSANDDIFIDNCGSELWFPNVFTPNKDGLNDRFRPVSLRVIGSFQILIFNRWGQQLYESNDPYTGWDGTYNGNMCPDGVYYYIAEYILGSQSTSSNQNFKRGAITLLR